MKMVVEEEEEKATHSLTDSVHHFSLPDYVKDTANGLSWKSPTARAYAHLWVFWSKVGNCPQSQTVTSDVRLYSCNEFPQRDVAVASGVKTVLALPVFEPSSGGRCVGVVEVIGTDESCSTAIWDADRCLQISEGLHHAIDEIDKMLEIACKTLQLPLAQTWTPCVHSNGLTNGDNFHLKCTDEAVDSDKREFRSLCTYRPLGKGQGLVGKALLFHKPCFSCDISQFSINEYPLAHHAREFGLTSSFAICLWSTYTGDLDYVLEFFLPPCGPGINGDVKTLLGLILATTKEHLPSFKVALGAGLVEELSAEVIEYLICIDELETSTACRTIHSPSTPEALENEGGIVQRDLSNQKSLVDDGTENGRDLGTVQQSNIAVTNTIENTCIVLERGEVHEENSLSYDTLKQHFGKKLEDVAEIFGVSRSTLKRVCRSVGISDWPSCKRKKVNRTRCNFKKMKGSIQGRVEGTAERSRTDPLQTHATLDVASSILHVTTMQDITPLSIKVIHGEDVIKFQMPHSSRMAELFENLTERLPLKVGTFRIKYQDNDGDWVLIACEKDLQYCITSSRSSATIKMLVQPLSDQ
ncbi:hypothetical protein RJ640_019073 [Escallonia rubra]|uniref:Uncharacterized protein n=1 Tax=Escallonia rubra TaxID=112253 RepID=A0AA88UVQ7_9ASTE|nr:hypothetical protein RJ640_019073 [Escallonia rubra]